jgi:hypothetical protein
MEESKRVAILFKSGQRLNLDVTDFQIHIANGKITGMDWEHSKDASIRLAFMDLEEIAAAWQVK